MELKGKKVVILGLGISGMEVARFARSQGADVLVRDNGDTPTLRERAGVLGERGISVELGVGVRESAQFDLGVLSPGIDPKVPLVQVLQRAGLPLMSELELAYHFCHCPIVAVTGTNGKTTTTELVAAAVRGAGKRTMTSGNIGTAFSSAVAESHDLDLMVLEVSSFQLECIQEFRPRVSVYLNLTPDHLDRYETMDEYRAAKWRVFDNQTENDIAIVNTNVELPETLRARTITLNAQGAAADYQFLDGWLVVKGAKILKLSDTQLLGAHNAENLLAALAVADLWELPREGVLAGLRAYRPLAHRLEKVGEVNGVRFLNDSKATNIDALEKALDAMPTPVVLIAGGKDKGLDFSGLRPLVREKVSHLLLIGQMAEALDATFGQDVASTRVRDLEEAVDLALTHATAGQTVLFSPGCSSFDMFRDYQERGDHFRRAVEART